MSIYPQIITGTGTPQGVSQTINDMQRQIGNLLVTANSIAPGSVTGAAIADSTITAVNIVSGTITAAEIAAGTITAAQIAAGAITGTLIAGGTITATNLAAGAVTAAAINVSSLSAVSGTMGTVTGGIFQTNTSAARVMMGSGLTTPTGVTAGIIGIDGSNNVTFSLDATTGNVILKGTLQQGSSGLGNLSGVTQNAVLVVTGTNLAGNPSVDVNDVGFYSAINATLAQDTTTYLTAAASLKVTTTASTSMTIGFLGPTKVRPTAPVGSSNSFSVYVLTPTARTLVPSVGWYNGAGTLLSTVTGTAVVSLAGQWVRIAFDNAIAPRSCASFLPYLLETASTAGAVLNIDTILIVAGTSAQASYIVANSITASDIAAGTITAVQIAANTITAGQIAAGTITSANIAAGTITAAQMTVTSLSAISANLGSITTGTFTGGTVQTATAGTGYRTAMDSTGLFTVDGGGSNKVVTIDGTTGISIKSGSIFSPASLYRIDWTDSVFGVVGSVYGSGFGSPANRMLVLETVSASSGNASRLSINQNDTYGYSSIGASVGGTYSAYLLDDYGNTSLQSLIVNAYPAPGTGSSYDRGLVWHGYAGGYSSSNVGAVIGCWGGSPIGALFPIIQSSFAGLYVYVSYSTESGYFDYLGFHNVSAKGLKQNFRDLADDDVLNKIKVLDVREWEHKKQPGIRRIGVLAEDFHEKFGLGEYRPDPKQRKTPNHEAHISMTDVAGVGLRGVQALINRVEALEAKYGTLTEATTTTGGTSGTTS